MAVATATAQVPEAPVPPIPAVQGDNAADVPAKAVLAPSDLRYAGAFRLPATVHGADASGGRALTHRQVGDQLRFLSVTRANDVYETSYPGTATAPPYPMAPIVRAWGDVYGGKRRLDGAGDARVAGDTRGAVDARGAAGDERMSVVWGLYWDARERRLYWSYGDPCNATSANDPSLGCSLLDDASGQVARGLGCWRFTGRGCKSTMGGVLPIPEWFASRFCGGRRLGAGFGGWFPVGALGPAHMGPALCAFAPPDPAAVPDLSALSFTELVGYRFNGSAHTDPDRCHRDTDYRSEFDGWNPRGGVGYWSWTDWLWQAAVWIDTPDKHGLVYFPILGNGRTWFESGRVNAKRATHWWYVYDPADLARVATGAKTQSEIQAFYTWPVQYPGLPNPLPGWSGEPRHMVVGATWDSASRQVFVALSHGWSDATTGESGHLVHVWRVTGDDAATRKR